MPRHSSALIHNLHAGIMFMLLLAIPPNASTSLADEKLRFRQVPAMPDPIGVAGPIVGVHRDRLIVAGGANFAAADAPDLWELPKQYHDRIWLLRRDFAATAEWVYRWQPATSIRLPAKLAYSAVVSIDQGVVCMGGEDGNSAQRRAFLLQVVDAQTDRLAVNDLAVPDLPAPATACDAAVLDGFIYLIPGQVTDTDSQSKPTRQVWRLPVAAIDDAGATAAWESIVPWPATAPERTHAMVTAQDGRLYVIGGRRFLPGSDVEDLNNLKFFADVWSLNPGDLKPKAYDPVTGKVTGENPWSREADAPVPMSAGTALPAGERRIVVLAHADGSRLRRMLDEGVEMKDFDHPGFPKTAYLYDTRQKRWSAASIPVNQVTTPAVRWGETMLLISGEIRPRVRSPLCWEIQLGRD